MSWIMVFLRIVWFSFLCSGYDMIAQNGLCHGSIEAFSRARTDFPMWWKSLFRNTWKPFYRLRACNMLMSSILCFCFISLCTCRCSVVRCLLHDSQSLDVIRIFLLIPPYCACLRFDSGTWELSSLYIWFWVSPSIVLCLCRRCLNQEHYLWER